MDETSEVSVQAKHLEVAIRWVLNELELHGESNEQIEAVQRALKLLKGKEAITESVLATRISRITQTADSQGEDDAAMLASLAFALLVQFTKLNVVEQSEFYKNARLPRSLLDTHALRSYLNAAENSKDHAKPLLDMMKEISKSPTMRIALMPTLASSPPLALAKHNLQRQRV